MIYKSCEKINRQINTSPLLLLTSKINYICRKCFTSKQNPKANIIFIDKEQYEFDFTAQKQGQTLYVQVAYLIPDTKVREREFGNLEHINDNYPKYVVSLDPLEIKSHNGIKHLHLRDFLTKTNFDI